MQQQVESASDTVIVAGTGPVGLIAALGVASLGVRVDLVGPAPAEDRRTTALMRPALHWLGTLGLAEPLDAAGAPLAVMRIVDATQRLIRSPVVTFRAGEIGEPDFGLNLPNAELNRMLVDAVAANPLIRWRRALVSEWTMGEDSVSARCAHGETLAAPLAIAADGRNSPAREAAGIRVKAKPHRQTALVVSFAHSRDHGSISTEFHTETGPFTQVPLPGRRSSLVWVVAPETADELGSLDDAALSRRIEDRMQSMLGRVTVEPGRQTYPLSSALPARFAANRVALVGEAAHIFPPIGAQGLNLGIRDVEAVVRTIREHPLDPGSPAALASYDRARRPDVLARSTAVGLLNGSLLSDLLPSQLARSVGLGALGAFAPLRAFFMREGLQPGSGFARIAGGLSEQGGR